LRQTLAIATAAWSFAVFSIATQAQPVQPPPTNSSPVGDLLNRAPAITISNGVLTAKIARIDAAQGFYNGTRFDQAGVVTSLTLDGREFYGPWFEKLAPDVLDYTYVGDDIVAGADSAISGPVEEFAPLDFEAKPGLFIKPGVGVLYQPDTQSYDHYRHYRVMDGGQRTTKTTKNSVTFSQALTSAGTGYIYEKTLSLVPGKPQLVITHRLRNTGTKPIITNVYDHNFLRLVAGNGGIDVTFPFVPTTTNPPPSDLMRIEGHALAYRRPMVNKERISFLVTGFGKTSADYDFIISGGGASVRVQGDQPVTRMNIFSVDRVQSVEPYIAIDLPPGAEKRWTYTYTYTTSKQ